MTLADTLRARKGDLSKPHLKSLGDLFETAVPCIGAVSKKRAELVAKGTLSERGVADELQKYVDQTIRPYIKDSRGRVQGLVDGLTARRQALQMPKPDPADVVGAGMRQEMRTFMRGLSEAQRAKVLIEDPDPRMIAAALEAPNALSGISDELRSLVETSYLKANFAPVLAEIEETKEAIDLVTAALDGAENDVTRNIGRQAPQRAA